MSQNDVSPADVREAIEEELPLAARSEAALRELVSEEVRGVLTDEELAVDMAAGVSRTLADDLRSELFKSGGGNGGPSPSGTISVYEEEEEPGPSPERSGEGGKR